MDVTEPVFVGVSEFGLSFPLVFGAAGAGGEVWAAGGDAPTEGGHRFNIRRERMSVPG